MSYNDLIKTDVIAIETNRISTARIALALLLLGDIHSRLKFIEFDINFTFSSGFSNITVVIIHMVVHFSGYDLLS